MARLYVAGIPITISEIELLELFSMHGLVSHINIIKEPGRSMGYGFVNVQDMAAAHRAINALNGKVIANCKMIVKLAENKKLG